MILRTGLDIVQKFRRRMLLDIPSSLVGSSDPDEIQLLELLYSVCEELRQYGTWTTQRRNHSFATVSGTAKYLLPADFYSPIMQTHWNQGETWPLLGPVSDERFNWHLYGAYQSTINYTYRIFGWDVNRNSGLGQFEVSPTPSSAQTLSFDYVTSHLFIPVDWASGTAYTAGNLVNVSGNIYKCATSITTSATAPTGTSTGISDGDGTWDWYNTPIEEMAADTDLCLFDSDVVGLGLRAKWLEGHGGEIAAIAKDEYRNKIQRAVHRFHGARRGSMARVPVGPRYSIPWKSWSF